MIDEFKQGYIAQSAANGDFGSYLQNPMTAKQRAIVVGRNMLLCRKNTGMSQQDVCSVIGIAPQTYSGYENGKHEPTIETLVRLAYLYGVSLDFLLSMFSNSEDDNVDLILHNTENNEAFQDLQVQIHIMKEEIDILRKKINAK